MPVRRSLDGELVRRGLARSRDDAVELVRAGRVVVGGTPAGKPATAVAADTAIVVLEVPGDGSGEPRWASRGATKLLGALEAFEPHGLDIAGRRCLDAGASTGGFTDVLLRRGAAAVIAVDVGYGQLDWRLRTDPRVTVLDRTNARYLTPELLEPVGGRVDLVVADLSFISLRLVLPALAACAQPGADLLPMVKPQFEAGADAVGKSGVVRDPAVRAACVGRVGKAAWGLGLGTRGLATSPLPGPQGNVEFFLWLTAGAAYPEPSAIAEVVHAEGSSVFDHSSEEAT